MGFIKWFEATSQNKQETKHLASEEGIPPANYLSLLSSLLSYCVDFEPPAFPTSWVNPLKSLKKKKKNETLLTTVHMASIGC